VSLQPGAGAAPELQKLLEAEGDGPANVEVVVDSVLCVNCTVSDCYVGIKVNRHIDPFGVVDLEWDGPRGQNTPAFILPDGDAACILAVAMDWSGLVTATTDDIRGPKNAQLALDCADTLATLAALPCSKLLEDEGYRLLARLAVEEAVTVHAALGLPLVRAFTASYVKLLRLPPMLRWLASVRVLAACVGVVPPPQGVVERSTLEATTLHGQVVMLGERASLPTPVNKRLLELLLQDLPRGPGSALTATQIAKGVGGISEVVLARRGCF
jgi:ketopantoate reductase